MTDNHKLIFGGVVIAALVAGFFGGIYYQKKQSVVYPGMARTGRNNTLNQDRGMGMGMNNKQGQDMRVGGMISGEISAKDEGGVTVRMTDGSSKLVLVNDMTKYTISSVSDFTKVVVGEKVAVFGESNSDGSITATSIELNPAMRGQLGK